MDKRKKKLFIYGYSRRKRWFIQKDIVLLNFLLGAHIADKKWTHQMREKNEKSVNCLPQLRRFLGEVDAERLIATSIYSK